MKRIKKKSLKATQNQFGALLESMDSKIDLVLEGHSALDAKIDKNHEEFKGFREETNFKFDLIFKRFDGIDKNFKVIFEYLSKIDDELRFIKTEIAEIKLELKRKADLSYLKALEERIKKLEKSNMEIRMMITQKSG